MRRESQKFWLSVAAGLAFVVGLVSLAPLSSTDSYSNLVAGEDQNAPWLAARPAQSEPPPPGDEEGEGLGRGDWFYLQRAYPALTIPPAARMQAIEQMDSEETWMNVLSWVAGEPTALELQPAWAQIGPMPIRFGQTFSRRVSVSGRISTVVLNPGYDGVANWTVYIGAAQGGVWRSTDNGANWTPLTEDQPSLAMGAIAIDPTNPNIIYAGTGEAHFSGDSYYGAGLLKSADGGATWTQITGPTSISNPQAPAFLNSTFSALAINPTTPSTLFAATEDGASMSASSFTELAPLGDRGIWRSTNSGLNWENVNPSNSLTLNKGGSDVLIDPRDHNRVFAAVRETGIYRSTAGGAPGTWEKLMMGLPASGFSRIKLAAGPPLPPSTDSTLYAGLAGSFVSGSLRGIFKSTDGGATWTQVTQPAATTAAWYALALAVDPVDANVVYFGTFGNSGVLLRSTNGGASWINMSFGNTTTGGLHVDTHDIIVSPSNRNTLFTVNDGGVWRTDNALAATGAAVAWAPLNDTLNITQFQSIALDPGGLGVMGGTQDNGTNIGFASTLPAWNHVRDGDAGFTIINTGGPPCLLYHTFFNANNFGGASPVIGLEITFNCGSTWFRRGCFGCTTQLGNFNPADRVAFYAPMAQHTGFTGPGGNVIYFGTHRLYRTADQGITWTGLGPSVDGFGADLTGGNILFPSAGGFPAFISAIAAHQTFNTDTDPPGEVVWTGSGDGVIRVTTNAGALAGASFTNVTKLPLPNRFITDIALDPFNQLHAVVTYSGFNANTSSTPGHVFLTTDQGATWTDISGNLPDVPVTSVALDPRSVKVIYVGTDIGVFQTMDGVATWVRLANGMPKVAVPMIRFHALQRNLVAATHGRGVFRMGVTDAPLGCALGQGYWKTHATAWPTTALMLGNQIYTKSELLNLLNTPIRGDASLILAHHLIAAKLNLANGANNATIAATVTAADNWLRSYAGKLPYNVKTSTPAGQVATNLAATLEQHNNGTLAGGPPPCN